MLSPILTWTFEPEVVVSSAVIEWWTVFFLSSPWQVGRERLRNAERLTLEDDERIPVSSLDDGVRWDISRLLWSCLNRIPLETLIDSMALIAWHMMLHRTMTTFL